MKPDEPGNEDDEPGGFIAIIGHIRRRPVRDRHGSSAHGEMAGGRYDRTSRTMNPSLHPNVYNGLDSPTMAEATGGNWRPWAPAQAGSSMGSELQPPSPDRGGRSGHEPADITGDHQYLTARSAPTPHNPLSAAHELHKAAYEECSGHEDDTAA
jgi:hypothetical protein